MIRALKLRIALLMCFAGFATDALAQSDSTTDRRIQLVQQLQPGTLVRIQADAQKSIGRLRAVTDDTITLDDRSFASDEIREIWIRQRSTRQGVKLGALIGAPAGAAFGAFVAWLANVLGESGEDVSVRDVAVGAVAFSTVGLVGGGAIGGIIGAGVPRWGEITNKHTKLPDDPNAPIGSIALTPAWAHSVNGDGGGVGARASYTFETKFIDAGLEGGRYNTGTTQQIIPLPFGDDVVYDTVALKTSVFHIGTTARVKAPVTKQVTPYGTVGFGLYSWDFSSAGSNELGGYSIGGGVHVRDSARRRGVFAEARYQDNLTRSGGGRPSGFGFYTIGVGASLAW